MNLDKLFETQKILRDRIGYDKDDRFYKLILSLLVEIGECANEWRGFKFWSKDQEQRPATLEEFVDGLHFILEQGIEIGETDHKYFPNHRWKKDNVMEQFLLVFKYAAFMEDDNYFTELLHSYIYLGELLGFTHEEIEKAYFAKNKINHKRQEEGY